MNQQGNCGQNHFGQPMQQDQPFGYNQQQQQQQQQNSCAQNLQSVSGNSCLCNPGIGQSQLMIPCNNYLAHNILEKIYNCVGNAAPIFVLPNSQPIHQVQQNPGAQMNVGYPNVGYPSSIASGYPGISSGPVFSQPCYQFPVPIPFCNGYGNQNRSQTEKSTMSCDCCRRNNNVGNNSGQTRSLRASEDVEAHRCSPGNDDTICTKPNCPASINLQALASQLLSLQGVIPCAATRLVLRRVPGSTVTTGVDETMDRAQKSIGGLNKDQLITEARNAQHVNGLINLHMMANPPQNIIPVLTMLQLKVNSLKALVENLVNKSVSECQSIGAEGHAILEPMILAIKSDAEVRELLATLRQKECEERVNVNYAPYHSQRVVAESRLNNFQNKINQVEAEIERRRAAAMPWLHSSGQLHQDSFFKGVNCRSTLRDTQSNALHGFDQIFNTAKVNDAGANGFDSPSPFTVKVQSPRRLNLKPNVGGPQTTYGQSEEERVLASQLRKFENNGQGCCRNGESWDQENAEPSKETFCSVNEAKKKLKIHIDDRGELSVKKESLEELDVGDYVELSPDVVIVIDKDEEGSQKKTEKTNKKQKKQKKNNAKTTMRKKSAESIPSDSTCDSRSEASVSSKSSDAEEKPDELGVDNKGSKSILKKISRMKKKKSGTEDDVIEKTNNPIRNRDKRVSVAIMLSDICKGELLNPENKMTSHESEFLIIPEDERGGRNGLEPSISKFENTGDDDEERLADYFETIYSQKAVRTSSKKICSTMRNTSSSNSIISIEPEDVTMDKNRPDIDKSRRILSKNNGNDEVNCRLRTSVKSKVLNEAQNHATDRSVHSYVVGMKKESDKVMGKKISCKRDNKENIMKDIRTCSIMGKKNRDNKESLEGISISSSMDMNHRKRFNYRFK